MHKNCLGLMFFIPIWAIIIFTAEARSISLEARVANQKAIETLYWKQTLWPADNPNPSSNSWSSTTTTDAPSPRDIHEAVWTGKQMIVWGGANDTGDLNTGGRYNP